MANKHIRVLDLQEPGKTFLRRTYDAMTQLGWYIQGTTETTIFAKTPETFTAQPQNIYVELLPENLVEIRSHNQLKTQVIDWGRNKKNVELLLATLDRTP